MQFISLPSEKGSRAQVKRPRDLSGRDEDEAHISVAKKPRGRPRKNELAPADSPTPQAVIPSKRRPIEVSSSSDGNGQISNRSAKKRQSTESFQSQVIGSQLLRDGAEENYGEDTDSGNIRRPGESDDPASLFILDGLDGFEESGSASESGNLNQSEPEERSVPRPVEDESSKSALKLSAEETIALTPPSWMEKGEAKHRSWVKVESLLDHEQFVVAEELSYDHCDDAWTQQDEDNLWLTWLLEDQHMLDNLTSHELTAWKRADDAYNMSLPEILPRDVFVDRSILYPLTATIKSSDGSEVTRKLEQTSWGQGFSFSLTKILACPAFHNLKFLQYVLQYVLFLRLGLKSSECPAVPNLSDSPFAQLANALRAKDLGPVPDEWATTVNDLFGTDDQKVAFPHLAFVEDLKKQVKKPKAGQLKRLRKGLLLADLTSIIDAWDNLYIKRPGKKLETIETYHKNFGRIPGKKPKKHDTEATRRNIRSWIMSCRRKEAHIEKLSSNLETTAKSSSRSNDINNDVYDVDDGIAWIV